ncbi:Diguanylate cyclase DosC [Lentibacillus sp. JNUCC-1]|uniref:putative bifunctional diguanylate cyclase/phosphodiesterase n=1 Tax=Lentibacillus sp. JNUCC-1 TaxID=2654513 RepID=UPI0012E880F1|nr:EAL domain-containing protein [Lentibacillus sp. JNUCC-1]MUV36574.1 Diguanylate cyclase DosC [Lentibacillus sp. JNUCC-1]
MGLLQARWMIVFFMIVYYIATIIFSGETILRQFTASMFPIAGGLLALQWVWGAYRSSRKRIEHIFWRWTLWGVIAYSISNIAWLSWQVMYKIDYYPGMAHVTWLLAPTFFLGGLLYLLYILQRNTTKNRFYFNIAIFMTAAAAITIHYLIQPLFTWSDDSLVYEILQVAHPILDLALVFALIHIFHLTSPKDRKTWFYVYVCAIVVQFVPDSVYVSLNTYNLYDSGSMLDPLWVLSILLIGYAGLCYKKLKVSNEWQPPQYFHDKDTLLPYVAVFGLLAFYIYENELHTSALGVGLGIVFILIMIRQMLVIKQNRDLIKEYRAKAFQDPLTSLNNRNRFQYDMEFYMERAYRLDLNVCIFMIDLDRFKDVNDSLGHDMGDVLLNNVAQRIEQSLGEDDRLYRFGGDEFVTILPNGTKQYCLQVAQKIMARFVEPITVKEYEISVVPSIGVSVYPEHGRTSETLLKQADAAMFAAKRDEGNHIHIYNEQLQQAHIRKFKIESGLGQAIAHNRLRMVYQPKVILDTRQMIGMEALMRWEHPELGSVSPGEFIPVAEETGQIIPIGEWALEEVCRQNKAWQEAGYPEMCVSVNVSVRQFQHSNFVKSLDRILKKTGLNPMYLEIEITESIMQSLSASRNILNQLHGLGVKVAIDDFGTGYSSLFILESLPIDTIKIDKAFIDDLSSSKRYSLVKSMIDIGENLNLGVVVEGIEQETQVRSLNSDNNLIGQGYLFGKPMPPDQIEKRFT